MKTMQALNALSETVTLHELTVIRQCQKLIQQFLTDWAISKASQARYVAIALEWEAQRLKNFANSLEQHHVESTPNPSASAATHQPTTTAVPNG